MTIRAPAARRGQLARLLRDQNGFVMAMVAILLPVLIGVTGLAAETGLWYAIKRQNQSAADEAAISGAMELVASKPDVTAQANCSAWRNGFDSSVTSSTCPTSLTGVAVNNPPLNGAYTGNSNYVEVILSQTQNALFASLSLPSVTIVTRAVATALSTPACLLGLGTSGTDVTASGGSAINTAGCSVVTNSTSSGSVTVSGGSTLTAQTIITRGPISPNPCTAPTCTLSSPANTTAPVTTDPYASRVSSITLPTTCSNPDPNAHVNQTLSPGCYNGMTFNGGTVTTLQNGVYFINNGSGFTVHSGATVKNIPASGNGVTIVLYNNAALAVQGGTPPATLTLTAPSSGGAPRTRGSCSTRSQRIPSTPNSMAARPVHPVAATLPAHSIFRRQVILSTPGTAAPHARCSSRRRSPLAGPRH